MSQGISVVTPSEFFNRKIYSPPEKLLSYLRDALFGDDRHKILQQVQYAVYVDYFTVDEIREKADAVSCRVPLLTFERVFQALRKNFHKFATERIVLCVQESY